VVGTSKNSAWHTLHRARAGVQNFLGSILLLYLLVCPDGEWAELMSVPFGTVLPSMLRGGRAQASLKTRDSARALRICHDGFVRTVTLLRF
jgi:hypothetical protein